jgi:hypothetical protein
MGSKIETAIKDFSHSMTIIVLVLLFLVYQVFISNRGRLSALENHLGSEAFGTSYASRLPVQNEIGWSNDDQNLKTWGQIGQQNCPSSDEANAYLAHDEAFLGGPSPPVFYDIGNVKDDRKILSSAGYEVSKFGVVTASNNSPFARKDKHGPLYYKTQGPDGNERWIMRTVHCNNAPGKTSKECGPWLKHRKAERADGFAYYPVMGGPKDQEHVLRYEPCQTQKQIVVAGRCVDPPPKEEPSESMTDSDLLYNQ